MSPRNQRCEPPQPRPARLIRQLCGALALSVLSLAHAGLPDSKSGPDFNSIQNPEARANAPFALRPRVHSRRNVDEFAPVRAKFVRFTILKTNRAEPCLDELEIFTAESPSRNVALASSGARIITSGTLPGYRIHKSEHLNDGLYGNGRSWISHQAGRGWVIIELANVELINRLVWGRDREGRFIDRLATAYRIEVATELDDWRLVASSSDRKPLETGGGAEYFGTNPGQRLTVNRLVPVGTTLVQEDLPMGQPEYTIDTWQTEDGLPSNTISDILQARNGYLWLATFNGLVRFDGVRFVVFGEAEGLHNLRIVCLYEDCEGSLWLGTEGGGLICYRDNRFTAYTTSDGLSHNVVLSIAGDHATNLWVATVSGLNCLRDGKIVKNGGRIPMAGRTVYRVLMDRAHNLWVVTGNLRLLRDGVDIVPPFVGEPAAFTSLQSIHEGFSGSLWVGGANGYVARLKDGDTAVFGKEHGLLPDTVWEIIEARNGDLWVGTASGGLCRLRNGKFATFTTQDGLSNNSVGAICEDREGNIWVGTNGGGLMRFKMKKLTAFTTRHGLSHDVVMSLVEDHKKRIWLGSNSGGLNLWQTGLFAPYYINYLLDNECIWSLCAEKKGGLWIGTWGGGLFYKTDDKIVNYLKADGLSDEVILALCEDSSGGLWIGTYAGGLSYFRDGRFTRYATDNGLSANFVTSIVEESPGRIWVGTSGGGLNCLANGKVSVRRRKDGLASDFIRTLHRDEGGRLWIGTNGGLALLLEEKLFSVTTHHGLIDNVVSQILEDDQGNLWLGSNQGISRLKKEELLKLAAGAITKIAPVSYGKAEGMESLECTGGFHPAGLKASDGSLWFSTVKGVVKVEPDNISLNEVSPPVVIEEMLIGAQPQVPVAVNLKSQLEKPVVIQPGVQRLEFRFTALSLVAPEKVRFKHKLEGLDNAWIESGARRSAIYTHLPPGQYRFRVAASNNDGVWNEAGAMLALSVRPQFWQTWSFRLVAALVAFGAVNGAARYISLRHVRAKLQRLEQQHALEKERTRIARDIHDDLGAGLTQISLLSDLGQKNRSSPEEVAGNFRQISTSAREIVQAMDAIVWAVNPKNDTLDHLANYLPQFAKESLACTRIKCRIDVPAVVPEIMVSAEIRHNLLLSLKEALHNVMKHAEASEVWVRLSVQRSSLLISIEDNGRGFDAFAPSAVRNGNGLVNMRKRLEEVGGKLEVKSYSGRGTKIQLVLHNLQTCGLAT